jgi:ABC-type bacteriocin/lantibiotic exporter with double-glycine peptidase domain
VSTESTFKLHIASIITTIILNAMSFKLYIDKKIPKETLVTTAVTSILFMQYYNSTIVKFKNTSTYIGKFYEINDYFNRFKITNEPKNNNFIITNGNIRFDNISLQYKNTKIIDNFSHNIMGGTISGIVGKVGTGKTSLLKMISGILKYEGTIYIDDQDINKYDYNQIMENVAYIPQHPKMFNDTIKYNLTYGFKINDNALNSFLKNINFLNFFNDFEQGLLTQVGKEGNKLSGGQKQIIALLRAILKNKTIFLLDEPTSSLDPETKNKVIKLIGSLKNKTILIVSHDTDIYKLFKNVIKF